MQVSHLQQRIQHGGDLRVAGRRQRASGARQQQPHQQWRPRQQRRPYRVDDAAAVGAARAVALCLPLQQPQQERHHRATGIPAANADRLCGFFLAFLAFHVFHSRVIHRREVQLLDTASPVGDMADIQLQGT